jgi:hypothetical protein
MAHISLEEAQAWLDNNKLTLDEVDSELEEAAVAVAFSALSTRFDTTVWTDDTDTPSLVRKVIAMLHTAWYYNRAYSEEADETPAYGRWLESLATSLLGGLAGGSIDVDPDSEDDRGSWAYPSFYPTDLATLDEDAPRAFSMGKVF